MIEDVLSPRRSRTGGVPVAKGDIRPIIGDRGAAPDHPACRKRKGDQSVRGLTAHMSGGKERRPVPKPLF